MIFSQLQKEPKYQAKALIVVMDTIKKNWLTAGAAVAVTIPSLVHVHVDGAIIAPAGFWHWL